MLNPRLALHYGIPDLPKAGFQKVTLKPEWNRGGLMTQAATLALSSAGAELSFLGKMRGFVKMGKVRSADRENETEKRAQEKGALEGFSA